MTTRERYLAEKDPRCRFGCTWTHLTLVHYPEGCWCFPDEYQWLCSQHTIKGLQNNTGETVAGYLHGRM